MPVYKLATPEFDEHSIVISCECSSKEHNIQLSYYDDPADWEMYVSFHLVRHGFFRRLWRAIKYVLGYHCRYGEWDELLIGTRDAREIGAFLQEYMDKRTASKDHQKA